MAIRTVLVANRGEIACRIIRAARALGIETLAVFSEADAGAPHVRLADRALPIGPAPAAQSYLDGARLIEAARRGGADAVHPGYGFLAENADFAEAVIAAGLTWIGPPPAAIRAMGDKAAARRLMAEAGVPVIPGAEVVEEGRATAEAGRIGFPLMVKAAHGGGGRGMRRVEGSEELAEALAAARAEAEAAFGSGALLLERLVEGARHVEVQLLADRHGAVIHLGERDCSVQRRHQKLIEEAPSPAVGPELRARMGAAAVAAARAVGYEGAGTVEFLLGEDGAFWFLEMNTRLQVEHPVTEAVTGLDLVALQFRIAEGAPLPLAQEDLRLSGHAIEARILAEDPAAGWAPSTGRIALWSPGEGVRVDDGIETGGEVEPWYDPMLAKIIAHGPDREAARRRLVAALRRTALLGPANNIGHLIALLESPAFVAGEAHTGLVAELWPEGAPPLEAAEADWIAAALAVVEAERAAALARAALVPEVELGWSSAPLPPVPVA
ncbi:MAG: ATP-grasp domain-containing protein, partial [Alphaproteobacteria bacterium]